MTWERQTWTLELLTLLTDLIPVGPYLSDNVCSVKANYKEALSPKPEKQCSKIPLRDQALKPGLIRPSQCCFREMTQAEKHEAVFTSYYEDQPCGLITGERLRVALRWTHCKPHVYPPAATQAPGLRGSSLDDKCSWELEGCPASSSTNIILL